MLRARATMRHYQGITIKLCKLIIINRPAITNYVSRFKLIRAIGRQQQRDGKSRVPDRMSAYHVISNQYAVAN